MTKIENVIKELSEKWDFYHKTAASSQVELLLDAQAMLGEGPSWHGAEQKLYWVDILGQLLHCYDPAAGTDQSWELREQAGCAVPRTEGGLLLYLESGFAFFDPHTGTHEIVCRPPDEHLETLPNEGKCDPAGRLWAGTKHRHFNAPVARLYCLHPDLTLRTMERKITISNGLAWNPEATVLYYIDTPTRRIVAYDYDAETGAISGKRAIINVPKEMGWPDGMTADREGMLWVAMWDGWQVARWNPMTEKLLATYRLPVRYVTSCCFGGLELTDLYITTARAGSPTDEPEHQPQAGGLFRLQTDVQGAETFTFAG